MVLVDGPIGQLARVEGVGRERETLRLYADGLNTKEIAGRMGVSVATVATFERRATMKLNARSRAHAIAICIRRHEF